MWLGLDARGKKVHVGHSLIDDQGRAWQVIPTERTLRKQKMARVQEISVERARRSVPQRRAPGSFTIITLYRTFRVPQASQTEQANKRRWHSLYKKYVRPIQKLAARRRRAVARMPFTKCPVCWGGFQPCRFKLGIPVWKSKKLRVCCTGCVYTVRKEVRRAQRRQPDIDRERMRRHIAWKYIRRGEQHGNDE